MSTMPTRMLVLWVWKYWENKKRHDGTDQLKSQGVGAAPSLAWNRDDALQDMLVRKAFRRHIPRPVHFVRTAKGIRCCGARGVGADRGSVAAEE
jgi:hypothetical protein